MECVYRRLKESITDSSFPVLPTLEIKSYFFQTQASQAIDVSQFLPSGITFNKLKVEAKIKVVAVDSNINLNPGFTTRGNSIWAGTYGTNFHVRLDSTTKSVAAVIGHDYVIVADANANSITIDGLTTTGTVAVSGSAIRTSQLLGCASLNAVVKVAEVKYINQNDDTLFAHFVPAILNEVPCVYEKKSGVVIYPADGVLGVE